MNSKKHGKQRRKTVTKGGKRTEKFTHHKTIEKKSKNIGAKRVTLLPGFLINGITSTAAKKTKGKQGKKTQEHLLNENLQAYLEQKNHLRRSQRILNKYSENNTPGSTNNSFKNKYDFDNDKNLNTQNNGVSPQLYPTNKSALKKNSKSIFKEISDQFSKVQLQNVPPEIPEQIMECANTNKNGNVIKPLSDESDNQTTTNCYSNYFVDNNNPTELKTYQVQQTDLEHNRLFCSNLGRTIQVTFKKDALTDCKEQIKNEIKIAHLIMEGKGYRKETVTYPNNEESDSEISLNLDHILPVPSSQWLYSTPVNQRIIPKEPDECQLHPVLLPPTKSGIPMFKQISNANNNFRLPVNPFPKVFKKTPAHLAPKRLQVDKAYLEEFGAEYQEFKQPWKNQQENGYDDIVRPFEKQHTQVQFVCPSPLPDSSNYPLKTKMPVLASYLESQLMPTPIVMDLTKNPFRDAQEQDFTFIQEGNQFKIQESQSAKRDSSYDEEEFLAKRRNFGFDQVACEEPAGVKMFDFYSQEKNIFDFGVIM